MSMNIRPSAAEVTSALEEDLEKDIFTLLREGGAQIQQVYGLLVPVDLEDAPEKAGDAEGSCAETEEPRLRALVFALHRAGIFADDMRIYTGTLLESPFRGAPYTVIDIPRLGKQIAVCDQIGPPAFVAQKPLTLDEWISLSEVSLEERAEVKSVRWGYREDGIAQIMTHLLDDGRIDPSKTTKMALSPAAPKPLFTESILVRWVLDTFEKTGRWMTQKTENIWHKDAAGVFYSIPEVDGDRLNKALRLGLRGLRLQDGSLVAASLPELRKKHGLVDDPSEKNITEALLVEWIKATHQKTGRWLTQQDTVVWREGCDGSFLPVKGITGCVIDKALRNGARGLCTPQGEPLAASLSDFRKKRKLLDDLTEDQLVQWIRDTHEKTGRWLTQKSIEIWCKDDDGVFHLVVGLNGERIDQSLRLGLRGLRDKDGTPLFASLAALKAKRHLGATPRRPRAARPASIQQTIEKNYA